MITLRTLTKGFFTKPDGTQIVELIRGIFDFTSLFSQRYNKLIKVTDETAMRPDLICQYFYKDQNLLDVFLKFNGVSNPFSVYPNQLLFAPDENSLILAQKPMLDIASTRVKTQATNALTVPTTKKDASRLTYLSKLTNQQILPTNVVVPGDTSITIVNGNVSFGDDVTQVKKANCPDPVSRTQIKTALLNSKIFNG